MKKKEGMFVSRVEVNENIGEVARMSNTHFSFTWKIENFRNYCKSNYCSCTLKSPTFTTGGSDENCWYLSLQSNYRERVNVYLNLRSSKHTSVSVNFRFFYGSRPSQYKIHVFKPGDQSGVDEFLGRQDILDVLLGSSGKLNLRCQIYNNDSWELKITELHHCVSDDLEILMRSESFSDLVLVMSGDQEIRAHRAVLAARSPVFHAMFESEMREKKNSRVNIPDANREIMLEILLYIYSGKINVDRLKELAGSILVVADKYALDELKAICGAVLSDNLRVDNALESLVLADFYKVDKLKKRTLDFIVAHMSGLIESPGLKLIMDSHQHLMKEILLALTKQ